MFVRALRVFFSIHHKITKGERLENKVHSKMCEGHDNNNPWIVLESKLGINNLA
jgi:hypothetical protein